MPKTHRISGIVALAVCLACTQWSETVFASATPAGDEASIAQPSISQPSETQPQLNAKLAIPARHRRAHDACPGYNSVVVDECFSTRRLLGTTRLVSRRATAQRCRTSGNDSGRSRRDHRSRRSDVRQSTRVQRQRPGGGLQLRHKSRRHRGHGGRDRHLPHGRVHVEIKRVRGCTGAQVLDVDRVHNVGRRDWYPWRERDDVFSRTVS